MDHDFRRIMKLVSYFSELRLNYCEFSKIKAFSGINKWLSKKEKHRGDTWQHQSVPRGMMMSPQGSGRLMSAVGPADVSIDQVNIDRWLVNGSVVRKSVGPAGQPIIRHLQMEPAVKG